MGRRQHGKNIRKHKKRISRINDAKMSSYEKVKRFIKRPAVVIGGLFSFIALVIGFANDCSWLTDKYIKSDEELFREKYFISGIHIPEKILNSEDTLNIYFGFWDCKIPISLLKNGNPYRPDCIVINDSSAFNLSVELRGEELFFSTSFFNFEGNYLGQMNYNEWHLKSDKISYYPSITDDYLEVFDDRDNIMFQMQYLPPNLIRFQGYFLSNNGTLNIIAGPEVYAVSNKLEDMLYAQKDLKQIKPLGKQHF